MKNVLLFLFFVLVPLIVFGQNQSTHYEQNKLIQYSNQKSNVNNFFKDQASVLGLGEDVTMKLKYENEDFAGNLHSKYSQYYKDLPVIGGTYVLHSRDKKVYRSTGSLYPKVNLGVKPILNELKANSLAMLVFSNYLNEIKGSNSNKTEIIEEQELCVIDAAFPKYSGQLVLAYEIVIENMELYEPIKKRIYINANTGKEIISLDEILNETVPATGTSNYYGQVEFSSDSLSSNLYELADYSRGDGIVIRNIQNEGLIFTDEDNDWNFQKEEQRSAVDVMYSSKEYYDFLLEKFDRNSIDGFGLSLQSNVNRPQYLNAFWNGFSSTFGAGDCNRWGPLTTLAIVGHEFTHGLTDYTSNLIYYSESGALNESISDIFGKTLEYFSDPAGFSWTLGERIVRGPNARALRSMLDPHEYNHPSYYYGEDWYTRNGDRQGVHTNSGVLNYWYYLLVEGGTGTNEAGVDFVVPALGFDKAIQIIYSTQVNYLYENSNYFDAFQYSLLVTSDLYGATSSEYSAVLEAWKAVGLNANSRNELYMRFDFAINGIELSRLTFEDYCTNELSDMELTMTNLSNAVIPAGTSIEGTVEWEEGNVNSDQIDYNIVLTQDLEVDSSLVLAYITIESGGESFFVSSISIDQEVTTATESKQLSSSGRIIYNEELSSELLIINDFDIDFASTCDPLTQIDGYSYIIRNRSCSSFSPMDFIELKIESGSGPNIRNVRVWEYLIFGNDFIDLSSLLSAMDIEFIGDYSEVVITGSYQTFAGEVTPLDSIIFAPYFIEENIELDEFVRFDSDDYKDVLSFNLSNVGRAEVVDEVLVITGSLRENNLQTCLGEEDYFSADLNSSSSRMSSIDFCAGDIDLIDAIPALRFDLYFEELTDVEESDLPYYHMVRVSQGGQALIQPIVVAESQFELITVPLDASLGDDISIDVLTSTNKVFIDNIRIEAIGTSNKEEIVDLKVFPNPVADWVEITCSSCIGRGEIVIFNALGKRIHNQEINNGSTRIDVKQWNPGFYLYQINYGDSKVAKTGKIIIAPE